MYVLVLFAVLATAQRPTPSDGPTTGQSCTPASVIGTWQFMGESRVSPGTTPFKHVTPTHFFVVRVDAEGRAVSGHGGTQSVADGTYSEAVLHVIGQNIAASPRGRTVAYQCRLDGDVWRISGEMEGMKIDERWRRVGAATKP